MPEDLTRDQLVLELAATRRLLAAVLLIAGGPLAVSRAVFEAAGAVGVSSRRDPLTGQTVLSVHQLAERDAA